MRSSDPDQRQDQIERALVAFKRSPWGAATATPAGASGLCKRASLVLLENLSREGIEDAVLWHLGHPRPGSPFAPSDEHYLVVVDEEAIDPSARQFDPHADHVTRRPLSEVSRPWYSAQSVQIGRSDPLFGNKELHGIPPNWRDLIDHPPPGDAIGWPYPGPWPVEAK